MYKTYTRVWFHQISINRRGGSCCWLFPQTAVQTSKSPSMMFLGVPFPRSSILRCSSGGGQDWGLEHPARAERPLVLAEGHLGPVLICVLYMRLLWFLLCRQLPLVNSWKNLKRLFKEKRPPGKAAALVSMEMDFPEMLKQQAPPCLLPPSKSLPGTVAASILYIQRWIQKMSSKVPLQNTLDFDISVVLWIPRHAKIFFISLNQLNE